MIVKCNSFSGTKIFFESWRSRHWSWDNYIPFLFTHGITCSYHSSKTKQRCCNGVGGKHKSYHWRSEI